MKTQLIGHVFGHGSLFHGKKFSYTSDRIVSQISFAAEGKTVLPLLSELLTVCD